MPRLPQSPEELARRVRLPALGVLLAAAGIWLGWSILDHRLARIADEQSAAGRSLAVATTRAEWAASVIPVAITGDADVADEARTVAATRIDLVASRAGRGDTAPLAELAPAILSAIRNLEGVPTQRGAEWAEWVVPRLLEATGEFAPETRLGLIADGDRALQTLASRPRRREAITETPYPELVRVAGAPEPAPPESIVPPSVESLPKPPAPPATAAVAARLPTASGTTREPAAWNPDWQSADAPAPTPQASEPPAATGESGSFSDRDLLVEFVELTSRLPKSPTGPSARGPVGAPTTVDDPHAETRRRLDEVRFELASRGYRSVSADQVARLTSTDPQERLRLVNDLLLRQAGDTAKLLFILATDDDGEVRAAAVGALGSSSSRAVVEHAYELATQDADPRVGRLAESLRSRLR